MMPGGETENGTGVKPAREIASDWYVGAETKTNRLFEHVTEFRRVVGVGARRDFVGARIVKVPVLIELNVLVCGEEIVSGWNLEDAVIESSALITAHLHGVRHGGLVPARGDTGGEESLDLRCEVEGVVVEGVEERLDAEAIARGEEGAIAMVPEDQGELAAQLVKAFGAEVFVEVKGDLAVGARA